MTTSSCQGWILHKRFSGDSSARVTLFTREHGLISCLCKGSRSSKKQVLLQPFTPLWLSLAQRQQWFYARQVEITGPALFLSGSALFSALYVNELLYYALKPQDASPGLYDAYQQTLEVIASLEDGGQLEAQLRRFEWILLQECGYAFSFLEEAGSARAVIPQAYYRFKAGEGFHVSDKGIPGIHLFALAEDDLSSPDLLKTAKYIMRQAIDHLLDGREIKARALFAAYSHS